MPLNRWFLHIDATAMRRVLHFITIDLGFSAAITCGLAGFWLLFVDAATDDVAALTHKASGNQRASEYVESITAGGQWPSHGQLIVAQANVSEILRRPSDPAIALAAPDNEPWQAYTPLLVAHLFLTITFAMCIRRLRRSKKW